MRYYFQYRRIIDFLFSSSLTFLIFYPPKNIEIFKQLAEGTRENLAFCLVGAGSSLLGFILAASTFLISHIQNQRFDLIRSSKSFRQLPQLISSSLWRLLILTVSGGLLIFIKYSLVESFLMILSFVVIWNLTALMAIIWIVLKIYAIPMSN
jgi:hypothetical protein